LLLVAGGFVLLGQLWLWALMAPLYGLVLARMRLEERALVVRHGEAYRRYRGRTFDPLPALISVVRTG
jgi:protein-S-isoprenylcysteine O-methyltransferase Ste14